MVAAVFCCFLLLMLLLLQVAQRKKKGDAALVLVRTTLGHHRWQRRPHFSMHTRLGCAHGAARFWNNFLSETFSMLVGQQGGLTGSLLGLVAVGLFFCDWFLSGVFFLGLVFVGL